jgi:predicted nucleic acid-binding protein
MPGSRRYADCEEPWTICRTTRGNGEVGMPDPVVALLDTSVLISPLESYEGYADMTCVSAVSIGELAFGLHTADPLVNADRERLYRKVLADYDPIPYDATVAHEYGGIAAAVRRAGRNPRPPTGDLMIAATARHMGAKMLTRNPDDFVGLDGIVGVVAL